MHIKRRASGLVLVCIAALWAAPQGFAFFPVGGSPPDQFQLRFARWLFDDLDTNNDGDISGPDEGIDITYEGGEFGFTPEEMDIIDEAFDVWENVPSAFIGFRTTLPVDGPDIVTGPNGLNTVSLQLEDETADPNIAEFGAFTLLQYSLVDTFFTSPDGLTTVPVTGGRIVEADIVVNAASVRSVINGVEPVIELKSVMVHQIGFLLGLDETPMNNLELVTDPQNPDGAPLLFESPAMSWRNEFNDLVPVGVTPTMFPLYFELDDGESEIRGGMEDLAVDDIAGVTFLYGRDSALEDFFTITGEARSQVRPGFASSPILGGLVTAWADDDNNPTTSRVPLVSTMTGLYVYNTEVLDRGRFDLIGLPKLLESEGLGTPFEASYTLTIEPILESGPAGLGPEEFDSTHNQADQGDAGWSVDYDTAFPSEVFHRDGGFFGRNNFDAGTPLQWDDGVAAIVVAGTGEKLSDVLRRGQPMFGDESDICPLLVIEQAAGVTLGPTMLRGFRDNVLLHTALGAAFVELYYSAGPTLAATLKSHAILTTVAVAFARTIEWTLLHPVASLTILAGLVIVAVARRRRNSGVATVSIVLLSLAAAFAAPNADAVVRFLSDKQKSEVSDTIVHGKVIAAESRQLGSGDEAEIRTDIVVEVTECLKGSESPGSTVTLDLPGGQVGTRVTRVAELPTFKAGEEIILYLKFAENHGYVVTGGLQGKIAVLGDAATGEPRVERSSFAEHLKPTRGSRSSGNMWGSATLDGYKAAIRRALKQSD